MGGWGLLVPIGRRSTVWSVVALSGMLIYGVSVVHAQTTTPADPTATSAFARRVDTSRDSAITADRELHPAPHVIRWYEAAAAVGGVAAMAAVDEPLQRYTQRQRSQTSDDIAKAFRHLGQPEVYGTVSLGILTVGLVAHQPRLTGTGGRLVASLALAGVTTLGIKKLTGRTRPDSGLGAFHFDPLSSGESLPSGHTSEAFALATSLAEDLHNTWASIALYTAATGTAFSRINDNRHWLSDTGLGALVGFTSARLVRGRWQLFGIRPPGFLVSPSGEASLGWCRTF
jgi:membrane-associated phospholipid phosphatase